MQEILSSLEQKTLRRVLPVLCTKKLPKIIFLVIIVVFYLHGPNDMLAAERESQKPIQTFSPDSFEYQTISEEEAFELHFSEDEYDPSTIQEYHPIDDNVMPQAGSVVTFCNEAVCPRVTVVFGNVSHPAYLSCYGPILFYNIPAGTYAWSASGCGRVSTGYLFVDGSRSYTIRVCPSPTQGCCVTGCATDGAYGCWQCIKPRPLTLPITTTSTSVSPTTTLPSPEDFSISGHMTGEVISDITIQLKGADAQTFVTDENGYYEFSGLQSGYYTITPREVDYVFEPNNYVVQNLTGNLPHMDFVAAQAIQGHTCPLETIYGKQSEKIRLLRYFRDNVLNKTAQGRDLIRLYYWWSPLIVKAMKEDKEFAKSIKEIIDGVLNLLDDNK